MADDSDDSQLKIVDFGLSKMIGPNETASDPFGTLVNYLYSLNIFSLMWLLKCWFRDRTERMLISGA